MERKPHLDTFGTLSLLAITVLLAFNQVIIKVVNDGLQPVFFAGIRSLGGALCVWAWVRFRGRRLAFPPGVTLWGVVIGVVFAIEFTGLFIALDLTTVTRTSVIYYSMPVWLTLAAHFVLPDERLGPARILGLALAFGGVTWAILDRQAGASGQQASWLGDFAALVGAWAWAGVILLVRLSPLKRVSPEMQNFWQLAVSAPILLLAAPLFGPLLRELEPIHLAGLAFQIVVIVTGAFLFWIYLISIYPASAVASFSFLAPIFGILLGWLLLGENAGLTLWAAGAMVALGLLLMNLRPYRARAASVKS